MNIKKILWPTDLSANAEKALPYVNSLTRKYQATIHILYVLEDLGINEPWYGTFESGLNKRIHKWGKKRAEERLDELCREYLSGCPSYIRHVSIGDPAEEILKIISEENVDVVVMTAREQKGKLALGSVTERVVENASAMIAIIPA